MTKACSNCGYLTSTHQLSGVSQRCPDCGEWVIWQPVEEADRATDDETLFSGLADRLLARRETDDCRTSAR